MSEEQEKTVKKDSKISYKLEWVDDSGILRKYQTSQLKCALAYLHRIPKRIQVDGYTLTPKKYLTRKGKSK